MKFIKYKDKPIKSFWLSFLLILAILALACNAQTTQEIWGSNGPYGGPVEAITLTESGVYIGTFGSGVFVQDRKGERWISVSEGLASTNITSLAYIPQIGLFAGALGGLFKYDSQSQIWSKIHLGTPEPSIYGLFYEEATGIIYAYGKDLITSKDNGITWDKWDLNTTVTAVKIFNGKIIIGTNDSILLSDGYKKWQFAFRVGVPVTSIDEDGRRILAGTLGKGVISSQDGYHWEGTNQGLQHLDVRALSKVKLKGKTMFFLGTLSGAIYRSQDGGGIWELKETVPGFSRVTSFLLIESEQPTILVGTYRGVFSTKDFGQTWQEFNFGLLATHVEDLVVTKGQIYAATTNGLFVSDINNHHWVENNRGLEDLWITSLAVAGEFLYAGTKDSGLYKQKIGQKWFPIETLGKIPIRAIAINPVNSDEFYVGTISPKGNPILYSTLNNGNTWIPHEIDTSRELVIFSILVEPVLGHIYVGTDKGIYYTRDGKVWTKDNSIPDTVVYRLKYDSRYLYAATGNGLFQKPINEENWIKVDFEGTIGSFVTALAVSKKQIFVGTIRGRVAFLDVGKGGMIEITPNIPYADVRALLFDEDNNQLIAGTVSGVWFRKLVD